jgi:P27 family predicted phage terminase small subunit
MAENDPITYGLMVRSAKGNAVPNPLVWVANAAMRDMVKYAAEFGMTPSSRSRIKVNDAVAQTENPFIMLK